MSSVELRQKVVRLSSGNVAVSYPQSLDQWFDGLVETASEDISPRKWVRLSAGNTSDSFEVFTSGHRPAIGLSLGDALATLWERVSFLLIGDLRNALALHAAVVCQENRFVLLPGRTGSGKTRLSLWYRMQGFDLAGDEIVTIAFGPDRNDRPAISALARPLFLKSSLDLDTMLQAPVARQDSPYGPMVRFERGAPLMQRTFDAGLIVFPSFTPGAPLNVTPLTPGETCLRLIENCLNVRNLPRGGLSLARALAQHAAAVLLEYGETRQLDETLNVLTRQILARPPARHDLAVLCEAFTAMAALRGAVARTSGGAAQPAVLPPQRTVPAPTAARFARRLTVGMATYDDYDGVYFTIQSIRINNPELAGALEFLVIDNNPGGAYSDALSRLGKWIDGYRYVPRGEWRGTAMRNAVFEEASSASVLCIDSHVLIVPGALSKLIAYLESTPDERSLLQGPLIYDDLRSTSTHMEPRWRAGMYGTWANDPRGDDPAAPAFEIAMQGLGLFACQRVAWPGFNPKFRGFGGEEGYIHEKVRQRGGRTLCLPFLRWIHRFSRPLGEPYANRWEDRMRNYAIGFTEVGLDTAEMERHFAELLGAETSTRIFAEIKSDLTVECMTEPRQSTA